MAVPDLIPITYGNGDESNQVCESTGAPVNGDNVIGLPWVGQGVDPALIDLERIEFRAVGLGPSVQSVSIGSLSPDKLTATLVFVQVGADQARVRATLNHTLIS